MNPVPRKQLVSLLLLAMLFSVAGAQYISSLSEGPAVSAQGASAEINLTLTNIPCWYSVLNAKIPLSWLELSAAGQSCVNPLNLQSSGTFCDESPYPSPPCLLDAAYVSTPQSNVCSRIYFLHHTLLQGAYNVCGFYAQNGGAATSSAGSVTLQIPTDEHYGPSYGLYLGWGTQSPYQATQVSPPLTVYLNGNYQPTSPLTTYFSSYGGQHTICNPPNGDQCFLELANASSSGGCTAPLDQNNKQQIFSCGGQYGNPPITPCILPNPSPGQTSNYWPGTIYPRFLNYGVGNYVVCGYWYSNLNYPSGNGYSSTASNPNPYESPFYASANIACSGGSCGLGLSSPVTGANIVLYATAPTGAAGFGTIVVNAINAQSPNQGISNVIFTSYGVQNPISLYLTALQSSVGYDYPSLCYRAYQNIKTQYTPGAVSALPFGNYLSYSVPSFPPGWPSGQSVKCSPADAFCGCVPYALQGTGAQTGDQCTMTTNTPVGLQTGNYLYCGFSVLPPSQGGAQLIASGFFFVSPNPSASGSTTINLGNAIVAPLQTYACSLYGTVNSSLFIIALTLMMLGALLYTGSNLLPPQSRGAIQGYAWGMLIGGIFGVGIAAVSTWIISVTTGIPISNIIAVCS